MNLPAGRRAIKAKWVFKTKCDHDGNILRYKARLVAKGCAQKYGIDYTETYSPVVRYTSIRFLFALAVKHGMKIHQMDATTAFLQGDVEETIYMDQPEGFNDGTQRVCKLNRSIYGLKQAGRCWNLKLDAALKESGLKACSVDPCIYYDSELKVILAIYVDDFLIFYSDKHDLEGVQSCLNRNFRMKDLGAAKSCLGIRIVQGANFIEIDQAKYITDMLTKFNMGECKPMGTPSDSNSKLSVQMVNEENSLCGMVPYQEAVGSILYLSQGTRPDIGFAINDVSRFNAKHGPAHWGAVKRIFRYLRATVNMKMRFAGNEAIHAYTDADWASDVDKRRSCTGYVTRMCGGAISWSSKRQQTIALSSTEAEYMALSSTAKEVLWLRQLSKELDKSAPKTISIYCDNQSAISLSSNNAYKPRSKHIDIMYHHTRELVARKLIHVSYLPTESMTADLLTKAIPRAKFELCAKNMGLRNDESCENSV